MNDFIQVLSIDHISKILTFYKLGEKPYKCIQCLSHFTDMQNLKRHAKIHTGLFLVTVTSKK